MDYHDRDLREVLAELAAAGGVTVVTDPAVEGRVTFKLNQVPWDQAFDLVVRVNGLEWTRDGDTLRVFPRKGYREDAPNRARRSTKPRSEAYSASRQGQKNRQWIRAAMPRPGPSPLGGRGSRLGRPLRSRT